MDALKDIRDDAVVSHAAGMVAADLDRKKVMMSIESGKYYGLDEIGTRIWELIEKQHTVRELVLELVKEYEVDDVTCRRDLLAFLNKLYDQGLIDIV
jgi:hypothetical protein